MTYTAPKTFTDILAIAIKADIVSWFRDGKTLSLITDNMPEDRRTCVELRIDSMRAEIKTLYGYGKKKPGMWSDYCAPCGDVTIENKQGLKCLLEWIKNRAEERTGYPNPVSFSVYKQSQGNYID